MSLKRRQKIEKAVEIMNEVLNRNKLKNSGSSIDKMVELIKSREISINYKG